MNSYLIILIVSVMIASFAQVLLKKSNTKKYIKNCKFFSLSSFIFGKYILKYNTGIRFYS